MSTIVEMAPPPGDTAAEKAKAKAKAKADGKQAKRGGDKPVMAVTKRRPANRTVKVTVEQLESLFTLVNHIKRAIKEQIAAPKPNKPAVDKQKAVVVDDGYQSALVYDNAAKAGGAVIEGEATTH